MIDALPLLLGPEGYQISRSVRLRSSASAYFNRTFGTATSRKIFTLSFWTKRGTLGGSVAIMSNDTAPREVIGFIGSGGANGDSLQFRDSTSGAYEVTTTAVFRDPSAWYHCVLAFDTTQATASNRVKMYVNGVQQTSFSVATYPAQNSDLYINSADVINIGRRTTIWYYDGYLTEVNFIDGLTPNTTTRTVGGVTQTVLTELGEFDAVTGVWKPVRWTRSYGTNGFYLNFSDNSAATAAAIGKDYSGKGNNWTPNNISLTAGATYDSMLDVPTQWADGGNGRGNYATLNPINTLTAGATVSGGNLNIVGASASAYSSPATMLLTSGKWYFEVVAGTVASRYPVVGVQTELTAFLSSGFPGGYTANGFGYGSDGNKYVNNGAAAAFGSTFTSGDVIGVAIDIDAGKVWLSKNNTWQASGDPVAGTNAAYTVTAGTALYPCVGTYNGAGTHSANFGQRPFAFSPPTGFKALNTLNLPTPTILKGNQYFDATTYTGNGGTLAVTNAGGMQPDFVWVKNRGAATSHVLQDAVRGAGKSLFSNSTAAESGNAGDLITSFNSNGFTVNDTYLGGSGGGGTNGTSNSYVGWQWKEGATQGFDIVTYTGTGSARTVAHNLGVKPSLIIPKSRSNATNWESYHSALGATKYIALNLTNAAATASSPWNNTEPTSSVFTVGTSDGTNFNGYTYVAYLFAEVAGFSRFGSYTGNGSADGPFVFCGFRPRFVMFKRTDTTEQWIILDSAREEFNDGNRTYLLPNTSGAEATDANPIDFVSNGFKVRTAGTGHNASGGTYIYAAFAENPFKNALAR